MASLGLEVLAHSSFALFAGGGSPVSPLALAEDLGAAGSAQVTVGPVLANRCTISGGAGGSGMTAVFIFAAVIELLFLQALPLCQPPHALPALPIAAHRWWPAVHCKATGTPSLPAPHLRTSRLQHGCVPSLPLPH